MSVFVQARADGGTAVGLTGQGGIDFGAGPLPTNGGRDLYFAGYDPGGNLEWGAHAGTDWNDTLRGVSVDPAGHIVVLGNAGAGLDLGSIKLDNTSTGTQPFWARFDVGGDAVDGAYIGATGGDVQDLAAGDSLLASYAATPQIDPSERQLLSVRPSTGEVTATSLGMLYVYGVAMTDGGALVTGGTAAPVDFGLAGVLPAYTTFLARFDGAGKPKVVTRFHDTGSGVALYRVVADHDGAALVLGSFSDSLEIDGAPALDGAGTEQTTFLAKIGEDGALVWIQRRSNDSAGLLALTVCPDDVIVAMTTAFNNGAPKVRFDSMDSAGNNIASKAEIEGFVARLRMSCDASGFLHISGSFRERITVAGQTFPPNLKGNTALLAKLHR
jgi:hypothetical protein